MDTDQRDIYAPHLSCQVDAAVVETKTSKKDGEWVKKSLMMRDYLQISGDFMPLSARNAKLRGVPRTERTIELLNISEAARLQTGHLIK